MAWDNIFSLLIIGTQKPMKATSSTSSSTSSTDSGCAGDVKSYEDPFDCESPALLKHVAKKRRFQSVASASYIRGRNFI